jgi:hypothetical protein
VFEAITSKPTYEFCTYDNVKNNPNSCESLEFDYHNVDGYWFYVYSGYSSTERRTYSAFVGETNYKSVSQVQIHHSTPPSKLVFNLGTTAGFRATNGYFYHVEFRYDESAYIGNEHALRAYINKIQGHPDNFLVINKTNEVQVAEERFSRWGPVHYNEWDQYDGAFEWATYGWSKIEGSLAPENELFRLTINRSPVDDMTYLGDRSLVTFIVDEPNGGQSLYFAVYHYGYAAEADKVNEFYKHDVTGKLTSWFYVYMGYSIKKRAALIYMKFGEEEHSH